MYAPHTVTVYNVLREVDMETFEEVEQTYITILRGVFLDAVKGVSVRSSGLESADAVQLYIPASVTAVDAYSGAEKHFVEPGEFQAAQDRSELWTLSRQGEAGETFFVKGEVVETATVARAMDNSWAVTKVDVKDYGRPHMQHIEVGGA